MKFYSSRNTELLASAEQAIVGNLCPAGGLYMPERLPKLDNWQLFNNVSLSEIGFLAVRDFFSEDFSEQELKNACQNAFNFAAPLVDLSPELSVLELTHGPSLAFKDFGARFLGEMLSLISKRQGTEFQILVATSGDTGGAVAAALEGKQGIRVSILFPKGRISEFQKGQMTRYGGNVQTIEVDGSFDECQRIVKEAFMNPALNAGTGRKLISANSINIARLIAQTVYYIHALNQKSFDNDVTFVVPSGNLGNLTAGIFALDMLGHQGHFVSAHNCNSTFPDFIRTGRYEARASNQTLSNAMDVGSPSNYERLRHYFHDDHANFTNRISAQVIDDTQTLLAIKKYKKNYNYLACPHTAVALEASELIKGKKIVLATANPKKFADVLELAGIRLNDPELEIKVAQASFCIAADLSSLIQIIQKQ